MGISPPRLPFSRLKSRERYETVWFDETNIDSRVLEIGFEKMKTSHGVFLSVVRVVQIGSCLPCGWNWWEVFNRSGSGQWVIFFILEYSVSFCIHQRYSRQ